MAEEPAAEWREAGAHDHGQIQLAGSGHNLLIENERSLVDHRQNHPLYRGLWIGRVRRADAQHLVDRGVRPLALTGAVEIQALAVLLPEAAVGKELVDYARCLHA